MDKLMVKTSDVKLDLSKYIDFNNVEKFDSEIIRIKIMDFKKDLKKCLPCEKMHILQNINDLTYLTYPKIDLSFLSKYTHAWNSPGFDTLFNYVPVFVLLKNINHNNKFSIKAWSNSWGYSGYHISCYGNKFAKTNILNYYSLPESIDYMKSTYSYNGVIPSKTKEKIKHAESIGLKDISLIVPTEKKDWNIEIINVDPIVIGFDNLNQARYIDKYDTISLEEQMIKEYVE